MTDSYWFYNLIKCLIYYYLVSSFVFTCGEILPVASSPQTGLCVDRPSIELLQKLAVQVLKLLCMRY